MYACAHFHLNSFSHLTYPRLHLDPLCLYVSLYYKYEYNSRFIHSHIVTYILIHSLACSFFLEEKISMIGEIRNL